MDLSSSGIDVKFKERKKERETFMHLTTAVKQIHKDSMSPDFAWP